VSVSAEAVGVDPAQVAGVLDELGPLLDAGDNRAGALFADADPVLSSAVGPRCALLRLEIERHSYEAASAMLRELRR
jgi:hypothetical protein